MKDYLISNYSDRHRFAWVKEVGNNGVLSGNQMICLLSEREDKMDLKELFTKTYRLIRSKVYKFCIIVAMFLFFLNMLQLFHNFYIRSEVNSWKTMEQKATNSLND